MFSTWAGRKLQITTHEPRPRYWVFSDRTASLMSWCSLWRRWWDSKLSDIKNKSSLRGDMSLLLPPASLKDGVIESKLWVEWSAHHVQMMRKHGLESTVPSDSCTFWDYISTLSSEKFKIGNYGIEWPKNKKQNKKPPKQKNNPQNKCQLCTYARMCSRMCVCRWKIHFSCHSSGLSTLSSETQSLIGLELTT